MATPNVHRVSRDLDTKQKKVCTCDLMTKYRLERQEL